MTYIGNVLEIAHTMAICDHLAIVLLMSSCNDRQRRISAWAALRRQLAATADPARVTYPPRCNRSRASGPDRPSRLPQGISPQARQDHHRQMAAVRALAVVVPVHHR